MEPKEKADAKSDPLTEEQALDDERRKKQENIELLIKILSNMSEKKTSSPKIEQNEVKKSKYAINAQDYFCSLLVKSLPSGELRRFFEYFKDELTNVIYHKEDLPALSLAKFSYPADRKALVALIDAQDENGFTALHWAVYRQDVDLVELLLKNGASTEIKAAVNNERPIDKLQSGMGSASQIHALFQQHEANRGTKKDPSYTAMASNEQITPNIIRDPSPFPFLELPIELQTFVLEELKISELLTMRCVCKYFRTLQVCNKHVDQLPEVGVFKFVDPPKDDYWSWRNGVVKQCTLTVMATPTVFHFGMIVYQYYKGPTETGVDTFVHEMTERIERFAKEDSTFKYDIERLKSFLLHSWQNKHRIYILRQNVHDGKHVIYVELDSSFGIGIKFTSPGDPQGDDDW